MYTSFYKLHSKPFQISSDPAFMWFGEKHKEALATLKYGILDNKGFLLLTGDVGTGKTSLINSLVQSLNEDIICTTVPDPSLDKMDFLNYIAAAFGMGREFLAKGTFLAHFREFLLEANEKGKKVLLIIDEAQLLTQEMLEEIRLLSNIEKADAKLINIFFIGQNEFNEILNRPQNRAVRQRLTLNYNLEPLTPDETEAYIRHRLKIAGTEETLFGRSAVQEVFMYSGGFPRRINILCDHSLLSGYVKEQQIIDGAIVRECAKELKIPAHVRNRDINGFSHTKPKPIRPNHVGKAELAPPSPHNHMQTPSQPLQKAAIKVPWGWIFALAICFFSIWILIFPGHFKQAATSVDHHLTQLKERVSPIIYRLLKPYLKYSDFEKDQISFQNLPQSIPDASKQKPVTTLKNQPESQTSEKKESGGSKNHVEKSIENTSLSPVLSKKFSNPSNNENIQIEPSQEKLIHEIVKIPKSQSQEEAIVGDIENIMPFLTQKSARIYDTRQTESGDSNSIEKRFLPMPTEKIILRFKYNTNDFTPKGLEQLENFSQVLSMHPEAKIMITGYTDSQGYAKYNKKLSEFRANIVKSFLLGKGIGQDQIQIRGLGGENPIETNTTAWGRTMNRRVEIEVLE
ncbi:AAA family ATPase [Desulfospira joergensenii]|uniref:AAA family ATPase n=1 Tax=Desulfospira joergensenii TaxID=53329 RepID=UPI0003B4F556|nr:AAA family ATPase [Desulfospira joergensenii]